MDDKRVVMTPKEYDLLFYFVKNKNIALTREKLLSAIWGYDFYGDDRTIDTHIKCCAAVSVRTVSSSHSQRDGYKFEYPLS